MGTGKVLLRGKTDGRPSATARNLAQTTMALASLIASDDDSRASGTIIQEDNDLDSYASDENSERKATGAGLAQVKSIRDILNGFDFVPGYMYL